MAVVKIMDDVLGRVCFFCGRVVLKLPAVKVAGSGDRELVLHPGCANRLIHLLGADLFQLDDKGTIRPEHLKPDHRINQKMLNRYG